MTGGKNAKAESQLALGLAAARGGQLADARRLLEEAWRLAPMHPGIRNALGVVRLETGDPEGAITLLKGLAKDAPRASGVRLNWGNALVAAGRPAEAIPVLERAVALDPAAPVVRYGLARALQLAGKPQEAIEAYRAVLHQLPDHVDAWANLAAALSFVDAFPEAEDAARQALIRDPAHANAQFNLGIALLSQGRWAEGWMAYESRYRTTLLARQRRSSTRPTWDGHAPLEGRTLLVQAEQGFGDTIQFVRYLPMLRARGATVILQCPQPLVALFRATALADAVHPFDVEPPPHDLQITLPSLPHVLQLHDHAQVMGKGAPYLVTPIPEASWTLDPDDRLRVGLVWAGSPTHVNDRHRSCGAAALTPLRSLQGVQWVSLQEGPAGADAEAFSRDGILRIGERVTDFSGTAAVLGQLDLVITIDSAVAHLAGALGTRCFLLLPRIGLDWRWAAERDEAVWYRSVRTFRQDTPGSWDAPMSAVRDAVAELGALRRFGDRLPGAGSPPALGR
jgi:tetratricopeptide (TPR) repeat protein